VKVTHKSGLTNPGFVLQPARDGPEMGRWEMNEKMAGRAERGCRFAIETEVFAHFVCFAVEVG
jgi:hypothetical protein